MDALTHYWRFHYYHDGELGYHRCEICRSIHDHGEVWIEVGATRYVLPRMILHYVDAHSYLPPPQFVSDLKALWLSSTADSCRDGRCALERRLWNGMAHLCHRSVSGYSGRAASKQSAAEQSVPPERAQPS